MNPKEEALKYMQEEIRSTVAKFIRDIFNYDKIEVNVADSTSTGFGRTAVIDSELVEENGHGSITFSFRRAGKEVNTFSISNIPAVPGSSHIRIFFRVIVYYMDLFYDELNKGYVSSLDMDAFMPYVERARTWLYNIERTIIQQYIFQVFNSHTPYTEDQYVELSKIRYDMNLIDSALSFAIELNTRKVENEEIFCGFIFHDRIGDINDNSMRSVRFANEIDFGNFNALKTYLTTSNGQDTFFNVTNGKITHLFVTKEKVNEVLLNPAGNGKTFDTRPLILSIQGNGKIIFIEGRRIRNQPILEINNSKPLIRDTMFVQRAIQQTLASITGKSSERIDFFSKWILSLSQKKHGTSLIFLNITAELEKKLVKSQRVEEESGSFLSGESLRHDMFLLDCLTQPDGAIIFNSHLTPTHISTILPINTEIKQRDAGGGARHSSVSNFTKAFNCMGIVVSEDGPISIFNRGVSIMKF